MDSFRTEPHEWDAATDAYARIREPLTLPYGLDTLEAIRAEDPGFAGLPRPAAWEQMETPESLQRELAAVGFRDSAVAPVAHRWEVPSARWFVENTDATQAFRDRLGPGSRYRIREAVLARLRAEFGDGPVALTAHAHIGVATK